MKTDGRQYSTVNYLKGLVTKPDQSSATKMCARDLKDRSHWKQTVKADRVPEFWNWDRWKTGNKKT